MEASRKHNTALTENAKALRKGMTKEERHLWYDFLRTYPIRFLRQKVIDRYIADFYCHAARLVIELDGSQHYEEQGLLRDRIRTERIESRKWTLTTHSPGSWQWRISRPGGRSAHVPGSSGTCESASATNPASGPVSST